MRSLLVVGLLLLSSAPVASQSRWTISQKPLLEIGVVEGDPDYELFDARSAVRLQDGRIVVLNAGTSELRFYDARGNFVTRVGRKGKGPGEFSFPARVYYTHRDSLLVFDQANNLESHFDARGTFVATTNGAPVNTEAFKRDAWFFGRYFVDGPPVAAERSRVKSALGRLPKLPAGEIGFVKVDPWYRLWVRPLASTSTKQQWTIFDASGQRLAALETPAGFELQQIGSDFVLGRLRKDLDVEFIQMYALRPAAPNGDYFTPAAARPFAPPPAEPAAPEEILATLRAFLRNTAGKQEVFYTRNYSYSDDLTKLGLDGDKNIAAHVLSASERGWAMVVVHRSADVMCGMAMGWVPVGWSTGQAICGSANAFR